MIGKMFERFVMTIVSAVAKHVIDAVPAIWASVKEWWNGKTIAVIGPTAAGKNSMFNKLRKLPPPAEHIQTRGAEQVGKFEINWALPDSTRISMTCKKSINVGGEVDERERYWLQSCNNADVVFYLIDGQKLISDQEKTLRRIRDDFKWLAKSFNSFKPDVVVHLLINKIDVVIEDADSDALRKEVSEKFAPAISGVEKILDATLGKYRERITGIGPISMVDDYLFNTYFTEALQGIQNIRAKAVVK